MRILSDPSTPWRFRIQKLLIRLYLRYFSFAIYLTARFILLFSHPAVPRPKSLLVLKPDAIGDYVLMRNFLPWLKNSERFKGYHMVWCGNTLQKSIIDHFDNSLFDEFIWIDKTRIYWDVVYYVAIAKKLFHCYEAVIQPVYSREFIFDYYAEIAATNERITFGGDNVNIYPFFRRLSNKWYTELIDPEDHVQFEFFRYKSFFQKVIQNEINLERPYFDSPDLKTIEIPLLPATFAVVFPGAQMRYRQWAPEKFAAVCDYLTDRFSIPAVLLGSEQDKPVAFKITAQSKGSCIDLTGKTSLTQVIAIIARSKFVITNDTVTAHIAPAVNVSCIALSQLNHYGRFLPYPDPINRHQVCVIPARYAGRPKEELVSEFQEGSLVDINLIETHQVISALENLIIPEVKPQCLS